MGTIFIRFRDHFSVARDHFSVARDHFSVATFTIKGALAKPDFLFFVNLIERESEGRDGKLVESSVCVRVHRCW
jgi:hypothetical protein